MDVAYLGDEPRPKDIVGNKGHNLMVMAEMGLPVPLGFILTVDFCKTYSLTSFNFRILENCIKFLQIRLREEHFGTGFRVSVRSSAPVSMPGMMDTILNVGSYLSLSRAVKTVIESWQSERCIAYRDDKNIPDTLGTAVIVQKMIRGDAGVKSGTGIVFTHNLITKAIGLTGDYLPNVQGDVIASGKVNPKPIAYLNKSMPEVYKELEQHAMALCNKFGKPQEIEFTVEHNKLYTLQTRDM